MSAHITDTGIIERLASYSLKDKKYWSFKGRSRRHHFHDLIQYPAMMVPEMQGELIDSIIAEDSNVNRILDPFVGSGTTLSESLSRGLDFLGIDINPLAILACEVKSGPLYTESLKKKTNELLERIESDNKSKVEVHFDGLDKWFNKTAQVELSTIYRAIKKEPSKWARKTFWLCISDTVRSVCNSRSSTYKLHIKAEEYLSDNPSAIAIFKKKLLKNIDNFIAQKKVLSDNQILSKVKSVSKVKVKHADSASKLKISTKYDLLITSPPYGDNQTTVTYGQFSYLPLMWIDMTDIDNLTHQGLLAHKSMIDSKSLGGSKKDSDNKYLEIIECSTSFIECVNAIKAINPENVKKLISFIYDLELSIKNSLSLLRDDAYMVWTLGNRRVSNIEVPLNKIVKELLESQGSKFLFEIDREIPSKRMPSRNQIASTMGKESVLVMRK